MQNLFTYGTLMLPELMEQLIGRIPDHQMGTLNHFQRFRVRNEDYPAIIPGTGIVSGIIYRNLSPTEINVLDVYESEMYERCVVHANTTPPLKNIETYVLRNSFRKILSDTDWDFTAYRARYMRDRDTF